MTSRLVSALARATAVFTVAVALLGALASVAMAQPHAVVAAQPVEPPTRFEEAAQLFREGRYAPAYGRFVRLANAGDAEAARIALVMHRHGSVLFGSAWDASTEELVEWSRLVLRAERADIEARRPCASALLAASGSGEAQRLAPETFRSGRRVRH